MQRLKIRNFGPIADCDIEINEYLVFTGTQASGKSTVAKSIFFFNNIKNLLFQIVRRVNIGGDNTSLDLSLGERLKRDIRNNFLQIFGTTMVLDQHMSMIYTYENGEEIRISLKDTESQRNFADIWISQGLWDNISRLEQSIKNNSSDDFLEYKKVIETNLFSNEYEIVYIPAGRSLMTLLSSQIYYLYSTLDDIQKRSMDYCTQNYLERILRLKSFFTDGFEQLTAALKSTTDRKINLKALSAAADINSKILKGEYRNVSGEDRLQISHNRYVKINYSSSGQQESVWILNVLFYYLLNNIKAYFIIEEPESHLFPEAQKLIIEFITMVKNQNNLVVITTHSPYVLGSINNLLYANKIGNQGKKDEIEKVVEEIFWLDYDVLGAYFLEEGKLVDIRNNEYQDIDHDVIDSASRVINSDYEQMVDIDLEERNEL